MQEFKRFFSKSVCFIAGFLIFNSLVYAQQIPHFIKHHGDIKKQIEAIEEKSKDKDKDLYALTFRIYNTETGGAVLWKETHMDVPVKKGIFEVILGSFTALDLRFNEDYWLSIEIDSGGEIIPRERMTSFGYAYMSEDSYKLGGRYPDDFALFGHSHIGEDVVSPVAEAINADTVDGLHADQIGGIKDHGLLEGLADDDHLQYLSNLRGDERYAGAGWDGLTKLKNAQEHIAAKNNPHFVTLEQLGHIDNNPEEEAPTATERGEPTGAEIQGWADDIMSWGHSNLVANLNADKLDGKDSAEFSLLGHFHTLIDLTDVTPNLRAAFLAAGTAGASGTNRLATMTDLIATPGLWTDGGDYIYPSNADRSFKITDTGNLLMIHGKVGIGTENPSRLLQVGSNSHSSGQGILVDGVLSLAWGEVGIPAPEIGLVSLWHEKTSPSAGYFGMKFFNDNVPFVVTSDGNVGIGTINPQGKLDVNGAIYQRGALLHADYVFEPGYKLESIKEHADYMWQEKHLKAVPKAAKTEDGQEIVEVGARNRGILEELEKAHIYIAQLNERLKQLEAKLAGEKADAR